eukprot:TRINITY_DN3836_c0_g1_i3.p1 TRINITY_DN3836_c0_g1~~TRINITY_DN3836_c0_g1_i3.p1  ORF type:complete len:309 (-),score=30.76 TRINITY_DN3836_c0_g1_i3:258-1184(-)
MMHCPNSNLNEAKMLQVEINRISAAFAGLSTRVSTLHRYIVSRGLLPGYSLENMPVNQPLVGVANGLAKAVDVFNSSFPSVGKSKTVVLMIVNDGEKNAIDQRLIEYELWERHQVSMIRRSLTYVGKSGKLNPENKHMEVDGFTVAVAYYRSGYTPTDYPSQTEWDARLNVERSTAIKCPNIHYHLIGTKKIQQVLANPVELAKFVDSKEDMAEMQSCFAGLYSLDPKDNPQEIIQKAINDNYAYVMKPQREGGGNLLFTEEMVKSLKTMTDSERAAYILMDRIIPYSNIYYIYSKDFVGQIQGKSSC